MIVGDCDKVGRGNSAKDWPDGGTFIGTKDSVILKKGERSRSVRSYADVTRKYVKRPLGQNRLIISLTIYFIKIYLHWVTPGPLWLNTLSQWHGQPHQNQLSQHILGNYTYNTSRTPGKIGKFDVKNEEKAPSGANKIGNVFGSRNTILRKAFSGMSEALNAPQVKFDCGEGKEGGRFSECLRLKTAYLNKNLESGGDVKTSIRNGKFFEPAWPDPVGPNPAATKSMLQAEYRTRAKRMEKLCINLSTAYVLVLGQCTDYLRSRLEWQEKCKRRQTSGTCLGYLKALSPCCTHTTKTQSIIM